MPERVGTDSFSNPRAPRDPADDPGRRGRGEDAIYFATAKNR
jgi:hypothetical protein